jgi:uncharacterized protein (DUF2236 family)
VDKILVDNTASIDDEKTTPAFYYAPESMIWKINREQVLLLGGARALLMQIAHPLVAESVYHHSYMFTKPYLRLKRTLDLTLSLVFGTVEVVQQATDEINRVHRPATGRLAIPTGNYPSGTPYNPRNPKLALWVYATLVEGALHGYETFIQPLSDSDKQSYYEDSKKTVALLGVKPSRIPTTYDGLLDYMHTAIDDGDVVVGETARKIAPFILLQSRKVAFPISYPISRLTIAHLPDKIRKQYNYRLHPLEAFGVDMWLKLTRNLVPILPSILRDVQPYRRAQSILKEQSKTQ